MRSTIVLAGVAALTLAACNQAGEKAEGETKAGEGGAPAAAALAEGPRPGLWRVTSTMSGVPGAPAGATPPVETCVTEAKFEAPPQSPGMTCTTQPYRRDGAAMVSAVSCDMPGGGKSDSTIRVTGDLSSRYTMESTTTVTGGPAAMPEVKMTMNAERIGDCPAA